MMKILIIFALLLALAVTQMNVTATAAKNETKWTSNPHVEKNSTEPANKTMKAKEIGKAKNSTNPDTKHPKEKVVNPTNPVVNSTKPVVNATRPENVTKKE